MCGNGRIVGIVVLLFYICLTGHDLGQCHRTFGGTTMQRTVASVFSNNNNNNSTMGPSCAFLRGSRVQQRLCRRDRGIPVVLEKAKHLANTYCKETFRYERWNCEAPDISFHKVYRETALVHAVYAAALAYSMSRGCGDGALSTCHCAAVDHDHEQTRRTWIWGGCGDNVRYGKNFARRFLQLRNTPDDLIAQLLKHNCEVGIKSLHYHLHERCKCHGISGSCQTKTCWRRLSSFQPIVNTLKLQYHKARRYDPGNRASPTDTVSTKYSPNTLLYLEKSPNFCNNTQGRLCLHPENCATLCCGRGFNKSTTMVNQHCKCQWDQNYKLKCSACLVLKEIYTCK